MRLALDKTYMRGLDKSVQYDLKLGLWSSIGLFTKSNLLFHAFSQARNQRSGASLVGYGNGVRLPI